MTTAGDETDDRNAVGDASGPVVALDASALMAPVEANVRLFDELDRLLGAYEAVVPAAVVAELDSLGESGGKEGTAASVGADLASRARTVETNESYADDALVELATVGEVDGSSRQSDAGKIDGPSRQSDASEVDYVVTNDRPLRDRLLERNVPVIGLRGRNALAITEP